MALNLEQVFKECISDKATINLRLKNEETVCDKPVKVSCRKGR